MRFRKNIFDEQPAIRFTRGEVKAWMARNRIQRAMLCKHLGRGAEYVSRQLAGDESEQIDQRLTMELIGVALLFDLPGLPIGRDDLLLPNAVILMASQVHLGVEHCHLINQARKRALALTGLGDNEKAAQTVLLRCQK